MLLEVRTVTKRYTSRFSSVERPALHDFSFALDAGELTAIMGPSGSGKTTLLNLIATIDRPTEGSIHFDGASLTELPEDELASFRRDYLGFIFQESTLLETLTLRENITLPLALQRRAAKRSRLRDRRPDHGAEEDADRVRNLAQLLGISDILDKYPVETSGGQRQRAAVARALAGRPNLILADEPTGSLDSVNARKLMQTLHDLNTRQRVTILLVTHDPLVASYCNRVAFIGDGRLFSELRRNGPRDELYREIVDVLSILEGAKR